MTRRRRPRRADRRHQRQGAQPAVRRPDQDQAGQQRSRRASSSRSSTTSWRPFLEEHPLGGAPHRGERPAGRPRPRGGAQGARPDPPQGRAGQRLAARQAGRLLRARPGAVRTVHRRGRQRRRLGQAGPQPRVPGHPAAARQDPERREGAAGQDPEQRRNPHADHGHRRGHRRRTSSTSPRSATTRSSS